MSTEFIQLNNRIVTDEGEVVATYDLLVDQLLSNKNINTFKVKSHPDVLLYNKRIGENKLTIWEDDGVVNGPSEDTYSWNIPKSYKELDIINLATEKLVSKGLDKQEYFERLEYELTEMDKRDMFPFVRCLIYIIDQFKKRDIVWGVGRGSSVASLVLYLLDINRVDPVKHDIPLEDFFK